MSRFFINRPIVAIVIAILTVVVGAITIVTLPVAQFPNIAPPEIFMQANYPGADAQTLEQAVATPIEQQVNGVDNMAYMYSLNATANQQMTMFIDFDVKTDPNTDLLLTQSREQLANGQLPPEVNSYGVTLKKSALAPFMLIALYSPHGTHDATYLANYAYINLNDPLARLYGVGQTIVFGSGQYAMRLWVKPDQLAKLSITVTDIVQGTTTPLGTLTATDASPFTSHAYVYTRHFNPPSSNCVPINNTATIVQIHMCAIMPCIIPCIAHLTSSASRRWCSTSRPCRARSLRCPGGRVAWKRPLSGTECAHPSFVHTLDNGR